MPQLSPRPLVDRAAPVPPDPDLDPRQPAAAIRARSVAARREATVCVAGSTYARPLAHAVTAAGRVYAVVTEDSALMQVTAADPAGQLPGMLVVTDICPIGVRDRVRGTLWLTGWLAAVPGPEVAAALVVMAEVRPAECLLDVGTSARLLELHLHDVILSDRVGTTDVPAAAFRAAAPDPLLRDEAAALQHLDDAHRDVLFALIAGLPDPPSARCTVRPVGLDSQGLSLRLGEHGRYRDVRLAFGRPLRRVGDLPAALQSLRADAR